MVKKLLFLSFILAGFFSLAQTNLANGTFSGGNATVIQIEALGGASAYNSDLTLDCLMSWNPQGSLCNSSDIDSQTQSTKQNNNSGATWNTGGNGYNAIGVLVIDLGAVQNIEALQVYQMFSDGKVTHIQFFTHSETSIAPDHTDAGWVSLTPEQLVGAGDISGNTVTLPTSIPVASTAARYLKVHVRNDGSYGDASYIELRSIKIFDSVLSSQDFRYSSELKFYPNPSKGVFSIESNGEEVSIEIFDLLGKKIAQKEKVSEFDSLDLSAFQNGIYFAKILNSSGTSTTYKLIKE